MPVQSGSMSPCTLCSLATPAGDTSDTTTVTPAAASARAVELPMPTGLPQPVISATRASFGMGSSGRFGWRCWLDYTAVRVRTVETANMATTEKLEHRTLGNGGLSVSAIGLGCMSLSGIYGEADDAASEELIRYAIDQGVDHLDSSDMYGWGHNEQVIGRALKGRRDRVVLATKFGQTQNPGGPNGVNGTARVRDAGVRGEPAAAGRRGDRPLLPAPRRSVGADRGHGRRDGEAGAAGQGAASRAVRGIAGDDPPRARGASDRRGADRVLAAVPRRRRRRRARRRASSASASSPMRRWGAAF